MNKKYYCKDCRKEINSQAKRCNSCAQKGRKLSKKTKQRISLSKKGKKLSKEHKEKISKAVKGKKRPNMSKIMKGHIVTKKTREKIGKKNRKYNITKEFLIREYIKNKKSVPQMAKKLRISVAPIYNRLKKFKIKIRKQSETQKGKYNKESIVNHHIYLEKNNDETMKLTRSQHRKLHQRAYEYIYEKYGKTGINNYIRWFKKITKGNKS